MDLFGVPISIWHSLVVEEHTGIAVFLIISLVVRILADLVYRGPNQPVWKQPLKLGLDFIAYAGSAAIVFFLIISGVTGYLIQPYSSLIASPILMNKSLLALGALFFWLAFFLVRFRSGPGLWEKKGLYVTEVITALLGITFTALTASMGAELMVGESAMEPVYKALNFSWTTFLVDPLVIEVTVGLIVIGLIVVLLFPSRTKKSA